MPLELHPDLLPPQPYGSGSHAALFLVGDVNASAEEALRQW